MNENRIDKNSENKEPSNKEKIEIYNERILNNKKLINRSNNILDIIKSLHRKLDEYYTFTQKTLTNKSKMRENEYYRKLNYNNLIKFERTIDDNNDFLNKEIEKMSDEKEKLENEIKKNNKE